jgi:hypothetical protein
MKYCLALKKVSGTPDVIYFFLVVHLDRDNEAKNKERSRKIYIASGAIPYLNPGSTLIPIKSS